jgi:hypothetical protein
LGEIDGILCDATKEKVPLAIFARGFSSDVIHTLKVNMDRGTLDVLPISFGVDNIETVNSVADVARVIGTDIITPLKGDLISACRIHQLKSVQKIICYNGNITLINSPTEEDVKLHVNELIGRTNNSHLDVSKLLNDRVKSLSGVCVLILLGSSLPFQKDILLNEIDMALYIMGKSAIPASLMPTVDTFSRKFINCVNSIDVAIVSDNGKSKNA